MTNGKEMYVWFSQTGGEQYFDLEHDPNNMKNLATEKPDRVEYWRSKLVAELTGREEGYVSDGRLVAGREPRAILSSPTS
jgi:hypothetical protein